MQSLARKILLRDYSRVLSFAAYGIAGVLVAPWLRASMWSGWCGTGRLSHFMLCGLWCGVAFLCALLECRHPRGSGEIALRFALAGIIPVAVPLVVGLA